MTTRLVRIQLIFFVLVAVVGIIYVGGKYVRINNMLGFGQYQVNAEFADSGGIFTNAEVTYRGVPVGTVGNLTLTETGVSVALMLNSGGPKIPANAKAVVADRSAIGEQYVDLQPATNTSPYLEDGSVITVNNTSFPVPVQNVLASANDLVKSVPLEKLTSLVNELGTAFNGKGQDLGVLVDSLSTLSQTFNDNLPQTLTLVHDSNPVLQTQSDQSSAIRQFSTDLDTVTAQLKASDPDIRRLINTSTSATDQISALLAAGGQGLTTDLGNIAQLTTAAAPKTIALRPLLTLLPALAAAASTTAPGDSTIHQGLLLETNNPPPCTLGYEGTQAILDQQKAANPNFDPTEMDFPPNLNANCTAPQGSITGVRSANRIIYADPAVPEPWDLKPKVDPDKLDLNPLLTQLAPLLGVTTK